MLLHSLWLAERPNMSEGVKAALLRHFSSPEELYYSKESELLELEIHGMTAEGLDALKDKSLDGAEKTLEKCLKDDVSFLTTEDSKYPDRLRALYDAPVLLYYKGTLPEFDKLTTVALVGTRKASVYGLKTAQRLGGEIARGGGLVVSGLADGIDSAAMTGALNERASVVGVLGCGIDVIYPRKNKYLYLQTECQGCILTEYAPGTPPLRWNFPKRNRIISGLSCGTVVVEAPEKSGSLLTARYALDQGRDVFVVPGNVDDPRCAGSNRLLRSGAIAISCGEDVLAEYEGIYPGKLPRHTVPLSATSRGEKPEKTPVNEPLKKNLTGTPIDKAAPGLYSDQVAAGPKLTEEEQKVCDAIGPGEILVDEVIAKSGLPAGKILSLLTMLELKGAICRLPGKRVSKKR